MEESGGGWMEEAGSWQTMARARPHLKDRGMEGRDLGENCGEGLVEVQEGHEASSSQSHPLEAAPSSQGCACLSALARLVTG